MMSQPEPTRYRPGSLRELCAVALPLVLSSGSISLMHVIDRVFLTWDSTEALAASMPAGMLHWTVMSIAIGTASYVNTFVAQYDGAGRKERVSASLWQGVYLSLIMGLPFLLVVPFSWDLFALFGHDPVVAEMEASYFAILCAGAVPTTMAAALACFYSGRGRTLPVMWINFFSAGVNVVLDYLLIFGPGPFPRWGIEGAAVATVIAQIVAVGCYVLLMCRQEERGEYGLWRHWRFDGELLRRLMRFGLPTGFQLMVDIAGFTLFLILVGKIGTVELAATNLAFNLNSLAFIPILGIGTAVMTIVGQRIGEGRPHLAVRSTWLAFGLSSAYMLAFAAVYLFLPELILAPYAMNGSPAEFARISEMVVSLLQFVALYSFFDGMAIVFGSAVRGAGDTRFSMIFSFLCGWLLMVLPTAVAWIVLGGDLWISWWACTAYIVVVGCGYLVRFQAGRWKSMRVIEPETVLAPATGA